MILGSGLTQAEQPAFDLLLRFFEGEQNAERKALALTAPFAVRCGHALMTERVSEITDAFVADVVMGLIADFYSIDPEIEYLFGERRDTRREQ